MYPLSFTPPRFSPVPQAVAVTQSAEKQAVTPSITGGDSFEIVEASGVKNRAGGTFRLKKKDLRKAFISLLNKKGKASKNKIKANSSEQLTKLYSALANAAPNMYENPPLTETFHEIVTNITHDKKWIIFEGYCRVQEDYSQKLEQEGKSNLLQQNNTYSQNVTDYTDLVFKEVLLALGIPIKE
jgi:hypothetical protein